MLPETAVIFLNTDLSWLFAQGTHGLPGPGISVQADHHSNPCWTHASSWHTGAACTKQRNATDPSFF